MSTVGTTNGDMQGHDGASFSGRPAPRMAVTAAASFIRAALAVAIAYVPLIYGFLIALPYVGELISNILHLLIAVNLVRLLQQAFPYSLSEAILCAIISMLAVIAFRLTIGRPITWVSGKLLNMVAGTEIKSNINEALAYVESKRNQS